MNLTGEFLLASMTNGDVVIWDMKTTDFVLLLWSQVATRSTAHFVGSMFISVVSVQMFALCFNIRDGHIVAKKKVESGVKLLSFAISNEGGQLKHLH